MRALWGWRLPRLLLREQKQHFVFLVLFTLFEVFEVFVLVGLALPIALTFLVGFSQAIISQIPPTEGSVKTGQLTKFNYVDQARLQLNEENTVLDEVAQGRAAAVHARLAAGEAARIAAQIIERLLPPVEIASGQVRVGASIGIACCPADAGSVARLIKRADDAMYAAKAAGLTVVRMGDFAWSHLEPEDVPVEGGGPLRVGQGGGPAIGGEDGGIKVVNRGYNTEKSEWKVAEGKAY